VQRDGVIAAEGSVVVLGYGNPSRGDDALGPILLERAEAWLAEHPERPITTVADFQLQVEHVGDLRGKELVLFLDADASCPAPWRFRQIRPAHDHSYTTHALSPGALLHLAERISGTVAPPAFILSPRGIQFDLGEPLSAAAAGHLESAWQLLRDLLADASFASWSGRVTV
jgi:hydrogenase maturation protease